MSYNKGYLQGHDFRWEEEQSEPADAGCYRFIRSIGRKPNHCLIICSIERQLDHSSREMERTHVRCYPFLGGIGRKPDHSKQEREVRTD